MKVHTVGKGQLSSPLEEASPCSLGGFDFYLLEDGEASDKTLVSRNPCSLLVSGGPSWGMPEPKF